MRCICKKLSGVTSWAWLERLWPRWTLWPCRVFPWPCRAATPSQTLHRRFCQVTGVYRGLILVRCSNWSRRGSMRYPMSRNKSSAERLIHEITFLDYYYKYKLICKYIKAIYSRGKGIKMDWFTCRRVIRVYRRYYLHRGP